MSPLEKSGNSRPALGVDLQVADCVEKEIADEVGHGQCCITVNADESGPTAPVGNVSTVAFAILLARGLPRR